MPTAGTRPPHHPHDVSSRRELARRLRQIRIDLGMTQRDVAEDIDVPAQVVHRIETFQTRDPIAATVQRHARGLDHAVRFRLLGLDVPDLPQYPHLPPKVADARHRADLRQLLIDTRRALGLSQGALSIRMNLARTTVGKMESAVDELLLSTPQRYARALGGRLAAEVAPAPPVDDVAIDLALAGERRFGDLSDPEKVVLFRDRVPRDRWNATLTKLRISGETARLWQRRAEAAA